MRNTEKKIRRNECDVDEWWWGTKCELLTSSSASLHEDYFEVCRFELPTSSDLLMLRHHVNSSSRTFLSIVPSGWPIRFILMHDSQCPCHVLRWIIGWWTYGDRLWLILSRIQLLCRALPQNHRISMQTPCNYSQGISTIIIIMWFLFFVCGFPSPSSFLFSFKK